MRGKRSRRGSAALLAALWLVVPVLSVIHGMTETHVYCAEHGAFEDHAGGSETEKSLPDSIVAVGSDAEGEAHHECAFACAAGEDVWPDGAPVASVAPNSPVTRALDPGAAFVASIPVFLTAPKNSPPLAI